MSRQFLARGIALLHPAALTAIWILCGVMPVTADVPAASLVLIALICGWAWALFTISTAKAAQDSLPRWTPWIFLAPPVLAVIAEIASLPTSNSPMALLIFGTLILGLWRAAQALEYADPQGKPVTVGRILATMLLMFFAIVGFWWLRHRIARVAGSVA